MREIDDGTVNGLIQAMVAFDDWTAQHLIATAAFAERVAIRLGLDEAIAENCRVGALLHDIGLLGTDKAILNYPGMLADAEWELMMQHPITGARLLGRIPSLAHLAPIVRAHHERVDGTGYPDALYGNEIPLEARIITVADAFHTMTMPVAYRAASTAAHAMRELIGNAGSQFDVDVVEAFGQMIGHRRREASSG